MTSSRFNRSLRQYLIQISDGLDIGYRYYEYDEVFRAPFYFEVSFVFEGVTIECIGEDIRFIYRPQHFFRSSQAYGTKAGRAAKAVARYLLVGLSAMPEHGNKAIETAEKDWCTPDTSGINHALVRSQSDLARVIIPSSTDLDAEHGRIYIA